MVSLASNMYSGLQKKLENSHEINFQASYYIATPFLDGLNSRLISVLTTVLNGSQNWIALLCDVNAFRIVFAPGWCEI